MWVHSLPVHGSSPVLGYTSVRWIQVSSPPYHAGVHTGCQWWYTLHSVLEFTCVGTTNGLLNGKELMLEIGILIGGESGILCQHGQNMGNNSNNERIVSRVC